MLPPAQATLTDLVEDSTSNLVNASVVIGEEITVEIDIKPDTLSSNSKGDWVTCYITPPEGYVAHDVDFTSVTLGDLSALAEFSGIVDRNNDGVFEAMVKFDRSAVIEMLAGTNGPVELMITGMFSDGAIFSGTDTINLVFH